MVRPERFELPTAWFVARYSIQLSYGRVNRSGIMRIGVAFVNGFCEGLHSNEWKSRSTTASGVFIHAK